MKKTIFMMSLLLALPACQKQTQSISIPAGYKIEQPTYLYMSMETCMRHARRQADKKDLQNAKETDFGAGGFMVSGTVDGLGPVIVACHAGPGVNATYATFLMQPGTGRQAAKPGTDKNHG